MDVPGFDGQLTCCTDWPWTKLPRTQSAVFVPLLACVVGPIEGLCSEAQLEFASRWWAAALPAWPRWVRDLKKAGAGTWREQLLRSAKGTPTPLMPKNKHCGTAPHFNGPLQGQVLELDREVAAQLCVRGGSDTETAR